MRTRMWAAALCLLMGGVLAGCDSKTGGGGAGGGGSTSGGTSALRMVSGGTYAKSASYRMTFTVGEPTQSPGSASSSNYQLQGGLNGAYGSLP